MTTTHAKLLHRAWCTACGAVAINMALAYLAGFGSLQEFWGL